MPTNPYYLTFGGNALTIGAGGVAVSTNPVVDPYNPLGLPPYTIRAKFSSGYTPAMGDSQTLVDSTNNVWDITRNSTDWSELFLGNGNLIEVLGANSTGVVNMESLFADGGNLTSVPLFDTRTVTNMAYMFHNGRGLTAIPLFDTGSATAMESMFEGCWFVESGALALYQQASSQTTPPAYYDGCFTLCGWRTTTGAEELAQIPKSWGGTYDPCNPLNLPAKTVRAKFSAGYTPSMGDSQTLVDSDENIWDIAKNNTSWQSLFIQSSIVEVLGANSTGVTNMNNMFMACTSLTSVPLFDTSSVTDMGHMFQYCRSLTSVPLFDTGSVTDMSHMFSNCTSLTNVPLFDTGSATNMGSMFYFCESLMNVPLFDTSSATNMEFMFYTCTSLTSVPLFDTSSVTSMYCMFDDCTAVESGALALYQQASSQTTPPSTYSRCFTNCGSNTTTGAAELSQIPRSWGGTGT